MLLYIMFYDKVFYCDMFLCLYDCFFILWIYVMLLQRIR